MIHGHGDVVQVAKVLKKFIEENSFPSLKIGVLEETVISTGELDTLAELPPREILLATVLGTLAAPMRQLVGVLNQKVASILYLLKAIQEKKEAI